MSFAAKATLRPTVEKRRTCSNCGRLGHLVTTCTNPERYHDMIGIEIEGWWWELPAMTRKANEICGTPGRRDGSIRDISSCSGDDQDDPADFEDPDTEDCDEGCDDCPHPIERRTAPSCGRHKTDCRACGARGWEFQTKPGSVGEALRQLTTLYPDVTSRAAGMHVHMSFRETSSISLLCSQKFFDYWKERWEKWGKANNVQGTFWERLKGDNQYCHVMSMDLYNNTTQHPKKANTVTQVGGGRYKAINFQAYDEHKTVEFRMLPMFQKGNLAVNAVEQLVDIVETYLQTVEFNDVYESDPMALPASPDEAIAMAPVELDFDVPVSEFEPVFAEVDLDDNCVMGPVLDSQGKPTGTVRMFRYQVEAYLSNMAADANDKKSKLADPKRHKVNWDNFEPNPTGRV